MRSDIWRRSDSEKSVYHAVGYQTFNIIGALFVSDGKHAGCRADTNSVKDHGFNAVLVVQKFCPGNEVAPFFKPQTIVSALGKSVAAIVYRKHVVAAFFVLRREIARVRAGFHSARHYYNRFVAAEIVVFADKLEFVAYNRQSFVERLIFSFPTARPRRTCVAALRCSSCNRAPIFSCSCGREVWCRLSTTPESCLKTTRPPLRRLRQERYTIFSYFLL